METLGLVYPVSDTSSGTTGLTWATLRVRCPRWRQPSPSPLWRSWPLAPTQNTSGSQHTGTPPGELAIGSYTEYLREPAHRDPTIWAGHWLLQRISQGASTQRPHQVSWSLAPTQNISGSQHTVTPPGELAIGSYTEYLREPAHRDPTRWGGVKNYGLVRVGVENVLNNAFCFSVVYEAW